jgi:hypothetical protein
LDYWDLYSEFNSNPAANNGHNYQSDANFDASTYSFADFIVDAIYGANISSNYRKFHLC